MNNLVTVGLIVLSTCTLSYTANIDASFAQVDSSRNNLAGPTPESANNTFASVLDLFVIPESVGGYGVYEERPPLFSPGEDIVLYVEPVGFSHEPVSPALPANETLYLMNFTADVLISDNEGNLLAGFEDLPISEVVSHHQNREVNLIIILSQSQPFPPGEYNLLYTIRDEPSGDIFELSKQVRVASENER